MLHPKQFEVNEAWIAFRLNNAPVRTELGRSALGFSLLGTCALAALLGGALLARRVSAAPESLPRQVARIPLPGVVGRIDHLALDVLENRLFVAALENGTIEVVDLDRNRRAASLEGLREPQGVAFLAAAQKLFVTNGEGAGVSVFRGSDLTRSAWIALRDDPDNIRYEPDANRLWIGEGKGASGVLAAINLEGELVAEVPLDGHPESFQLEARGPRIFVNVPRQHEVEVVDRERRLVVARWRLPHSSNFPMALDEARERLFVGCRQPAKILVLDARSGTTVAELDSPADADDIFFDPSQDRVYVSGGEGFLRIYARKEVDQFEILGDLPTGPGARTSLFVPESHRLYVAVPRRGKGSAEILAFETAATHTSQASILATWKGASICVGNRPACKDEVAVYRFEAVAGKPDMVLQLADKIIDGKRVPMGKLEFRYDESKGELSCEFTTGQTHGLWQFKVSGDSMEGTLVLLPDRETVRRVNVKKVREDEVPVPPARESYDGP